METKVKHLLPNGKPKYTNSLIDESSPYLRQHAHNPVEWRVWGKEAFEEAERRDCPILLSIGYSTCHWCHVMEEESFEDEEIAAFINQNYVAIKVDREERPDLDSIFMNTVRLVSRGHGGWPMTLWLTSDQKPYYGATYIPARDGDRGSQMGFLTILYRLREYYRMERAEVLKNADDIISAVKQFSSPFQIKTVTSDKVELIEKTFKNAWEYYAKCFDNQNGGLEGAPKFPSTFPLRFFIEQGEIESDEMIWSCVKKTLYSMGQGGIYDQIGGGFHRYSVDEEWLVPHFEKMLYDNALLARVYLEGYQKSKDVSLKRIATEILNYIAKEMCDPRGGGFYSATDADSLNKVGAYEEGAFFVWSYDEVKSLLTDKEFAVALDYFNIKKGGNFEGHSIFHTPKIWEEFAKERGFESSVLDQIKAKLYEVRLLRHSPLRDEKILTSWNGLMISSFAKAAFILDRKDYGEIAKKAAHFILEKMVFGGNRLYRNSFQGKVAFNGYLDDYSFFIAALLDLFEYSGEGIFLEKAILFDQTLFNHFEDKEKGGCYFTSDDHEKLLTREKPFYDGAEPSGNSIQYFNLLRLYHLTLNDHYRTRYEKYFNLFIPVLSEKPMSGTELLPALLFERKNPKLLFIPIGSDKENEIEMFLRTTLVPELIKIPYNPKLGVDQKLPSSLKERIQNFIMNGKDGDKPLAYHLAYLCDSDRCYPPIKSIENLKEIIQQR